MLKFLCLAILLTSQITTFAQTAIHTSELESVYGTYYHNGEPLDGNYKILFDDGLYDLGFFDKGEMDGYYMVFKEGSDQMTYKGEFFKGKGIASWEYDEQGNLTEEIRDYTLELLEGEKNELGRILNGKVKLIDLDHDEFSMNFATEIITLKNGRIDGDILLYDKDERLIQRKIFEEGRLLNSVLYTHQGTVFDTLHYRQDENYTNDTRKRLDEMAYYLNNKKNDNGIQIWTGADQEPLNGDYLIMNGDVVIYEHSFINGIENGLQKTYDKETGLMKEKFHNKNGQFHGVCTWYSDGHIERKYFREGIQHGLQMEYDPDTGIITDSVNFVNGQMEGLQQKRWTGKQKEHAQYVYKNGKIHGPVETFAQTIRGKEFLKQVENYMHGALHGKKTEYDSAGNIVLEETYKFGKLHGPAKGIDYEGMPYNYEYRMGEMIASKSFDEDGNLLEEWEDNGGKITTQTYSPDGNLKSIHYGYHYEYKISEGDTVLTQFFDEKGKIVEEKFEIVSEELDLMDFAYTVDVKYDKKGKVIEKLMTIEKYPNVVIKEFDGEIVVKEYSGAKYPDHGDRHTVKYLNKKGEVIKNCTRAWFDKNEYDDIKGIWQEEKCD
ncbi:MAG: hypothetical protein ACNS60_10595 [Candidatus Cyclobacteriaceae bacterium M2_1C_046]